MVAKCFKAIAAINGYEDVIAQFGPVPNAPRIVAGTVATEKTVKNTVRDVHAQEGPCHTN